MSRVTTVLFLSLSTLHTHLEIQEHTSTPEQIAEAIRSLGDDSFEIREAAQEKLLTIGLPAIKQLRTAMHSSDVEIARRASAIVDEISKSYIRDEMKLLEGTWKAHTVIDEGELQTLQKDGKGQVSTVRIKDGNLIAIREGKEAAIIATLRLYAETNPKEIDFNYCFLFLDGTTGKGIYEVNQEELKFCSGHPDEGKRPTCFESKPRSHQYIEIWRRVKD
jgi:uncharacterized protein (TIGR03067 family)